MLAVVVGVVLSVMAGCCVGRSVGDGDWCLN